MDIGVLSLMLIISILLIVAAWLIGHIGYERKGYYLFAAAFLLVLLSGLFLLMDPLEYVTGSTVDTTVTPNVIEEMYTPIPSMQNYTLSLFFILTGLWGLANVGIRIANDDEDPGPVAP